jgi:hypothetical protein
MASGAGVSQDPPFTGHEGGEPETHKGYPRGMSSTHADPINRDPGAFIRG